MSYSTDVMPFRSVLVRTRDGIRAAVPELPTFSSGPSLLPGFLIEEYDLAEGEVPPHSSLLAHTLVSVHYAKPGATVHYVSEGREHSRYIHASDVFVRSFEEISRLRWDNRVRVRIVTIFPKLLNDLARAAGIRDVEFKSINALHDPNLSDLINELTAELASGNPRGTVYAESVANTLVFKALATYSLAPTRRHSYKHGFSASTTKHLLNYLHENLDQRISITSLAELTGYPLFVFQRLFKRTFAWPVHHFLLTMRIKEAQRLMICDPELPLGVVAARTGFAHQSHLSVALRAAMDHNGPDSKSAHATVFAPIGQPTVSTLSYVGVHRSRCLRDRPPVLHVLRRLIRRYDSRTILPTNAVRDAKHLGACKLAPLAEVQITRVSRTPLIDGAPQVRA